MRAQTSLPALGFSLLVLTAVLVFGVAVADGALLSADRDPLERQAALDLSDRLVGADAPLTDRENVVNATALRTLDGQRLRARYGLAGDADATVSLDGRTAASTGETRGGTTLTRLVLVRVATNRTIQPGFSGGNRVTLPRRTDTATLTLSPQSNRTITAVRANDRVVLRNASGLRGTFDVSLSPFRTVTLRFAADGPLTAGSVEVRYRAERTRKGRLEVRVDA